MTKYDVAKTPPMGWNSWDCYGAAVTEKEIRANAEYMAKYLKPFGWEYIVCDIQWYEPTAKSSIYNKFAPLEMDEYSRLIPAVNRFPSAAFGKGFCPLADEIHQLGLKFGIHIMRGIPRQAAANATKILGTNATARDIAHPYSICSWNTDMYGVDPKADGAYEYYKSLFELYAQWNIDFVKVDDICVTEFKPHDLYSAREEIELIRRAIDECGRDIVLSVSPGPAQLEVADHLTANANMWRMTGDYWDRWIDLYNMFERCNQWSPYVKESCWPDCDMLPLGHIGIRSVEHGFADRQTNFTKDEQRTMMTLWCIFRSPLMMGGDLCDNDEWTYQLLTNQEVLRLLSHSKGASQIFREDDIIVWKSYDEDESIYIAVFNLNEKEMSVNLSDDLIKCNHKKNIRDLWKQEDVGNYSGTIHLELDPHASILLKLSN